MHNCWSGMGCWFMIFSLSCMTYMYRCMHDLLSALHEINLPIVNTGLAVSDRAHWSTDWLTTDRIVDTAKLCGLEIYPITLPTPPNEPWNEWLHYNYCCLTKVCILLAGGSTTPLSKLCVPISSSMSSADSGITAPGGWLLADAGKNRRQGISNSRPRQNPMQNLTFRDWVIYYSVTTSNNSTTKLSCFCSL